MNKSYTYDGLGRLSREDNADLQKTYTFVYDNSGNILTKKEYQYTTGSLENLTPINTYSYTYNKNMLVSVVKNNDVSNTLICSYPTVGDSSKTQIGNPLTYCGKTLSWSKVHQLASFNGLTFGYNYAGIRTRKGNIKFAYEQDKLIVQQNADGSKIVFYYGLDGLTGFNYNNQTYFYRKNIFGDILGIYKNAELIVKYAYDAWGENKTYVSDGTNWVLLENSTASDGNSDYARNVRIAKLNPFLYRGYCFDRETGLYYLNARYYDPAIGRFLCPDDISYLDPTTLGGLNLYAYCNNNPVMYSDPSGNFGLLASVLIGAAVGFLTAYIPDVVSKMKDGVDWSDFNTFEGNVAKYVGATFGGAIGGLGSGLVTTIIASGIGNVVEAAFSGEITSFGDAINQFVVGGISAGVGFGISKGITKIFADKKIFGILGNLNDNLKVNNRLKKAGFGYLKIGKHGLDKVYNELYEKLNFDNLQSSISWAYDSIIGLFFQ